MASASELGHGCRIMANHDRERPIREAFEAQQLAHAASETLEVYGSEILSFLFSRLRDPSNAREVFSIFAEDLWWGLPAFGWRCSVWTWAYTLARNAASRYMASPQKGAARHLPISQLDSVSVLAEQIRSVTNIYQRTDVKDRFKLLREQLNDEDQTLLILRVDRGMAWRDLAITMSGDADLDDENIGREAARLRKTFERIKSDLRSMAEREGLLTHDD